jgi:hypothetical protein
MQEGSSVTVTAAVTGDQFGTSYGATITITNSGSGLLVQASTLKTIPVILVIAVLFVVVEVYRRHKTKPATPTAA